MDSFASALEKVGEIGYVEQTTQAVAFCNGLPHAKLKEVVIFESGELGRVLSLKQNQVEILTFSQKPITIGTKVARLNKFFEIPVGPELLGHSINPLGNPLSSSKPFKKPQNTRLIDVIPSSITNRKRIVTPCSTGMIITDLLLPLGKGQRELLIGDRKTGKTQFALNAMTSQIKEGSIGIYAAIGKKKIEIKKVEEFFKKNNITNQAIIVASACEDPSGIIFLTPFVAMAIAEYFRDEGKNVILIFDDLSTHAKFYREISLLSKIFPGRDSYPGDIFYNHARLLERAGNFITGKDKETSITCLPIVETIQGDLSGYIQTNLMSITDGHFFFDSDLFSQGRRPAINPFLSVTRVGYQTQSNLKREIYSELNNFLNLHERIQNFIHFATELPANAKAIIDKGEKVLFFLKQEQNTVININLQIILFAILWSGFWDAKNLEEIRKDIDKMINSYRQSVSIDKEIDQIIAKSQSLDDLLKRVKTRNLSILKELKA